MKIRNVLLIFGGSTNLCEELVRNGDTKLLDIVVIGRKAPLFPSTFVYCDMSKRITDKDLNNIKIILLGRKIQNLIWFCGEYRKVSFSDDSFIEEVEKQFFLSVINILIIVQQFNDEMSSGHCSTVIISSLLAHKESVSAIPYSLGKSTQISMVRNLALLFGKNQMRFNTISPSLFESRMSNELFMDKAKLDEIIRKSPLNRVPTVESIVELIIFLMSNKSKDITGQDFIIDCGNSLGF